MGSKSAMEERLTKVEDKWTTTIKDNKKMTDASINSIIARLSKMEKEMESVSKEREEREKERAMWKKEKMEMQEAIDLLKGEVASLRERPTLEEGEITPQAKEAIKEELTKAITESVEGKLEATKEGWVEVMKKNIKKEAKEDAHKEEILIVHTTLEEEKMRQARRFNIRVNGIEERDSTPERDGRALCTKLGYKEEDPLPFTKAWRAGKDLTKKRALILHFPNEETRSTFIRKRVILRDLPGTPIYLDDDLTKMQIEHRRACMPKVHQARKEGKRAIYRDGRVIIDGKAVA